MLFHPLDRILATPNKVRVLRVLAPLRKGISAREVARRAGVSHKAITALDELAAVGIVTRREATGQNLYSLNRRYQLATWIVRLFQAEDAHSQAIMQRLRQILGIDHRDDEADDVEAILVYGSMARNDAIPGSDLDVLVMTRAEDFVEPVFEKLHGGTEEFRGRFGLTLSPVVLTTAKARHRWKEGDPFLASVVADAVVVYGVHPEDWDGTKGTPEAG